MGKKKKDVTTIYVIRHGESESNVFAQDNPDKPASQFGELGSSLTQKGRNQALNVATHLKNVDIAAIYSSDLNRTRETAEIIAYAHHIPLITDPTIRDQFFVE